MTIASYQVLSNHFFTIYEYLPNLILGVMRDVREAPMHCKGLQGNKS
jgi:hypothetical protein